MKKLAPRFAPLTTILVVSLAAACGGNVVVDHGASSGPGGNGSGANGTGAFGGNSVTGTSTVNPTSTGDVNPTTSTGFGGVPNTTSTGFGGISPVGVGPEQCDCNLFCKDIEQCFQISDQECHQVCNGAPQNIIQCACDFAPSCQQIANCFQQGQGGTTQGGTGGFGVGGTVTTTTFDGTGGFSNTGGFNTGGGSSVSTGGGSPVACGDCAEMAFNGQCGPEAQTCEQHHNCENLVQCEVQCNFEPNCVNNCKMQFPHNSNRASALLECAICEVCSSQCASTQAFTTVCTLPP